MIKQRILIGPVHVILFVLGVIAILIISTLLLRNFATLPVSPDEFDNNYQAVKQWITTGQSPYDFLQEREINATPIIPIASRDPGTLGYYHHPLIASLIIAPFTFLALIDARALWIAINVFLFTTGVTMIVLQVKPRIPTKHLLWILLIGNLGYFSVHSYMEGSLLPLVIGVLAVSLMLLSNRKDQLAGFILTLTFVDFLGGLLCVLMMAAWAVYHKRHHFIRALVAGLIFQVVISLIVLPSWLSGWFRSILLDTSGFKNYPSLLGILLEGQSGWLNLVLHLTLLLYMIVVAINTRGKEGTAFFWGLGMVMTVGSLLFFPTNVTSLIFCLPAINLLFIVFGSRNTKSVEVGGLVMMLVLSLIPYIMIPFTHFQEGRVYEMVFVLSYPVVAFSGLWWIRWWIMRPEY